MFGSFFPRQAQAQLALLALRVGECCGICSLVDTTVPTKRSMDWFKGKFTGKPII